MKFNIPKDWFLSSSQITANCDCGEVVPLDYDGEIYEGYAGDCPKCRRTHMLSAYDLDSMHEMEGLMEGPQVELIAYMNPKYTCYTKITMTGNEEFIINSLKEEYGENSIDRYEVKPLI